MTWAQYDGAWIKLVQQKTDELVEVPCHVELRRALDSALKRGVTILVTPTGRSFKPSNFNVRWKAVARRADIDGLQFRDLRRTAMVRLAEAGANAIQISGVSGHSIAQSQAILERYIPRNREMAKAAVLKLEQHKQRTKV